MTTSYLRPQLRATLLHKLSSTAKRKQNDLQKGFTLVELMIVIVIVGILSAVAIPQFMKQTKKAVATEATSQTSAITKQAATYNLETPITTVDTDCSDYSGTLPTGTKFAYGCSGSATAFVVTATGATGTNAAGITVTQTSDLSTGVVGKPVITGV